MSSLGVARRGLKRHARDGLRGAKMPSELLDLNLLPPDAAGLGGLASSSEPASHIELPGVVFVENPQTVVPLAATLPLAGTLPHPGMNSSPIDVEAMDDDVMIYSPTPLPQTRQRSTRREPITVILDDDSETTSGPTGDAIDEHVTTLLSLGLNPRHDHLRMSLNNPVIDLLDTPEDNSVKTMVELEPIKEVPKEPKFTCPVCMNELEDASSTICGHIFCQKCIKAAVKAQKKCPTCRRKLTVNNFHRVYLPTTE